MALTITTHFRSTEMNLEDRNRHSDLDMFILFYGYVFISEDVVDANNVDKVIHYYEQEEIDGFDDY